MQDPKCMYKPRREYSADQLCESNLSALEEEARGDADCKSSRASSFDPHRARPPRLKEENPSPSDLDLEERLHSVSKQLVLKYVAAEDWAAVNQLAVSLSANCSRIDKLEKKSSIACQSSREHPASPPMEQAPSMGAKVTVMESVPAVASPEEKEVPRVTDGVEEGEKEGEHSEQVTNDLDCKVTFHLVDINDAECSTGTRYQVTTCVCGEHPDEPDSVKVSHKEFHRLIEKLHSKVDITGVRDLFTQLSDSFTSGSNGEERKDKCERLSALFNQVLQNPELQSDKELLGMFDGRNPPGQAATSDPSTTSRATDSCQQGLLVLMLFLLETLPCCVHFL